MGRLSKVDKLPPEARKELLSWLENPAISRAEATAALHELLDGINWPKDAWPAEDSVNRYAKKFSDVMRRRAEANEVAEHWVNKFGRVPQGQLGQLVVQMIQGMAFDRMVQMDGTVTDPEDPEGMAGHVRLLRDLAQVAERTERAASLNAERERKIRQEIAEEAAALATAGAKEAGLSDEAAEAIGDKVRIYLPDNQRQGAQAHA